LAKVGALVTRHIRDERIPKYVVVEEVPSNEEAPAMLSAATNHPLITLFARATYITCEMGDWD
jgi:hypothetical protein